MKKLIVILGSLIALVLIVVIGGVAYLLSFDPNQNKALIASKFKEATGRTLALDGPITLSYYPWFGLSLDQVSISNADGFSAAPLLHANHLAARVKLLPLLSKSIEIDTVHVDGLALNLEVRGDGRNNWTFGDTAAPNAAPEESSGTSISDIKLILGGVDIRDTSLVFDDQFANSHYQLNNLNLQIGELVYGEPLTINMSLDAASRAPQLSAALALSGTVLYDLDRARYDLTPLALSATLRGPEVPSGAADLTLNTALSADAKADTLTLSQLELNALGSHLSATAEVKKFSSAAPSVDAKLDVSGDDLAVLLRVLGQSDLAQRVASLERSFKVQSSLTANMDTGALSVPALSAKLLGATIDGKV
ncbi:MAG: AsmA family protein, partial [Pseudomonadales bacterium]|nr:AsmA family protein [Pseudomonadales bacterium]